LIPFALLVSDEIIGAEEQNMLKSTLFAALAASFILAACGTPPTPTDTGWAVYSDVQCFTRDGVELARVTVPIQQGQSVVLIAGAYGRLAQIEVVRADGEVVRRYLPYVGLSVPVVEYTTDGVTYTPLGDGILPYSSH